MGTFTMRTRLASISESRTVIISPLTEFAVVRSAALTGTLAENITAANAAISLASGLTDVTTVDGDPTKTPTDLSNQNAMYGMLLAGLSQYAKTLGVTVINLVTALKSDFTDGTFNGVQSATAITISGGSTLSTSAWATGVGSARDTFIADSTKNTAGFTSASKSVLVGTTADTTSPTVGGSGTLATASVTTTTLTLSWTKATDTVSTQSALQYLVYRSTSNNISSVATCEANGTSVGSYAADISSKAVTGLTASTAYYFNVLVKDEAGNKAVYTAASVTTVTPTYTVGGTLSGLSGTVVLQNNSGDNLTITSTGGFTFSTSITDGSSYSVTVSSHPSNQFCFVSSGSGSVASANVTAVSVGCIGASSVNLRTYIDDFPVKAASSEGYSVPSAANYTSWGAVIDEFLAADYAGADTLASALNYEVLHITDTGNSNAVLYCLAPKSGQEVGRGVYCVYPASSKVHHIGAPHNTDDLHTEAIAVDIIRNVGFRYLSISTTRRCANAANSSCSAATNPCGTFYKVSDMAHVGNSFFHLFAIKVHNFNSSIKTVQIHGCGSSDCPTGPNGIVARLSVGTKDDLASTALSNQLNTKLKALVVGVEATATTKSCNLVADSSDDKLCATDNTQGRYVNGQTSDPCETSATPTASSRFLHIEANSDLRLDSGGGDQIRPTMLTDAMNEVF